LLGTGSGILPPGVALKEEFEQQPINLPVRLDLQRRTLILIFSFVCLVV
jgi:hypothetical protein